MTLNLPHFIKKLALILLCIGGLVSCQPKLSHLNIKDGQTITIRCEEGFYISADTLNYNMLLANQAVAKESEEFSLKILDNNKVAFKCASSLYLSTAKDSSGLLVANGRKVGATETFLLTKVDSGKMIIQDYYGKYLTLNNYNILIATENSQLKTERFTLVAKPVTRKQHFLDHQITWLSIGLGLILISILVFQYREDKKVALGILFLGGLGIRIFMMTLDTQLHYWDEQFHALVAKNMMTNPFRPMLYLNPVLPYDKMNWINGHIWLHKQPLFLWQMALSMKLFGINTVALRLPSAVMMSFVILFTYRVGKLTVNANVGFYAALLFALSSFGLNIGVGIINTDHNDVAFLFYLSASIWAWYEYENADRDQKKYFLVLIGLFSGCAILVKWLTGLLVFSGWGVSTLLSKKKRTQPKLYLHMLVAFVIAVIVFLPWQIYIHSTFPEISLHEYQLNTKHFFQVIENHGGDFWFHFNKIEILYGISQLLLLIFTIIFCWIVKPSAFKTALLTYAIIIYLFFGIAATKMIAFTFCVSFLVFVIMGAMIDQFLKILVVNKNYLPKNIHQVIYVTLVLATISSYHFDIDKIKLKHTTFKKDWNHPLVKRRRIATHYRRLSKTFPEIDQHVLFNCPPTSAIVAMFFTDAKAAYDRIPNKKTYLNLKRNGHKIAIFDNEKLPEYLINDTTIIKLDNNY